MAFSMRKYSTLAATAAVQTAHHAVAADATNSRGNTQINYIKRGLEHPNLFYFISFVTLEPYAFPALDGYMLSGPLICLLEAL